MEYLVGFFVGVVFIILFYRFIIKSNMHTDKLKKIIYSQSHIVSVLKPFGVKYHSFDKKPKESQASQYEKSQSVKVVMTDAEAYWIRDNVFYMADISEDHSIDKDSTRRVDTMSMDKVQLEKIMFIVEKLTEDGGNEDRNSGYGYL